MEMNKISRAVGLFLEQLSLIGSFYLSSDFDSCSSHHVRYMCYGPCPLSSDSRDMFIEIYYSSLVLFHATFTHIC